MEARIAFNLLIFGSLILALMLEITPLPDWAVHYRPLWVPLTVMYWLVSAPKHINLGAAWALGLLLDVALGGSLGQHALAMIVPGFVAVKLHKQFQLFSVLQQASIILVGLTVYLAIVLWIDGVRGEAPELAQLWKPLITSVLLWPWLYAVLDLLHRRFAPEPQ